MGIVPALVTLGETMALLAPEDIGPLRHADRMRLTVGGAESNVAIGAARLGLSSAWIGRVGDDELGSRVLRELRAEGVQVHARVDPSAPTGLMIKERRTAETGRVWYYRRGSAGSRLHADDVDAALVAGADVLHLTGITPGLSETARGAIDAALDAAATGGTTVSLDLNHRAAVWPPEDFAAAMRALLPRADVVFASPQEAGFVVGDGDPVTQARALARFGPPEVVLKLGAEGAVALVNGELHRCPAVRVAVVDTVGAGDAFVAGWLAERAQGALPSVRMITATQCGALACTVRGDWEGSPTRAELHLLDAEAGGRPADSVRR